MADETSWSEVVTLVYQVAYQVGIKEIQGCSFDRAGRAYEDQCWAVAQVLQEQRAYVG